MAIQEMQELVRWCSTATGARCEERELDRTADEADEAERRVNGERKG